MLFFVFIGIICIYSVIFIIFLARGVNDLHLVSFGEWLMALKLSAREHIRRRRRKLYEDLHTKGYNERGALAWVAFRKPTIQTRKPIQKTTNYICTKHLSFLSQSPWSSWTWEVRPGSASMPKRRRAKMNRECF